MALSRKRLPRKFNRPTSQTTRDIVSRRRNKQRNLKIEKWKRSVRKAQRAYFDWQRFVVRWSLVFVLLILTTFFLVLVFSPAIQVKEIRVVRTSPRLDIEQVQQILSPLFRRHLFFLSEFEVTSVLKEQLPDLDTVEIAKVYPSLLELTIGLDPLIARLQVKQPLLKDENGNDIPDDPASGSGVIVADEFLTSEGVFVSVVGFDAAEQTIPEIEIVDWGVRPKNGEYLLSPEFIDRLIKTQAALTKQFGLDIEKRTVYVRAQEFHLKIAGSYSLWFDVRSPLEDHLERYKLFLESTGGQGVNEYVDLRLSNTIVWK